MWTAAKAPFDLTDALRQPEHRTNSPQKATFDFSGAVEKVIFNACSLSLVALFVLVAALG